MFPHPHSSSCRPLLAGILIVLVLLLATACDDSGSAADLEQQRLVAVAQAQARQRHELQVKLDQANEQLAAQVQQLAAERSRGDGYSVALVITGIAAAGLFVVGACIGSRAKRDSDGKGGG